MTVAKTAKAAEQRRWLTVADICEDLVISRATWDKWRVTGQTPPCHRLPGRGDLRVLRTDYEEWLESLREAS